MAAGGGVIAHLSPVTELVVRIGCHFKKPTQFNPSFSMAIKVAPLYKIMEGTSSESIVSAGVNKTEFIS